jgi:hypothetical protein
MIIVLIFVPYFSIIKLYLKSRELSPVGRDITFYMQESGFEAQTLHLFTLKGEILATRLPDKKKNIYLKVISYIRLP